MHGYWPFEYVLPSGPRRRVFALFCSAVNPDVNDVAQCIVDYCETRRPPDRIYLIAPQSEKTALAAVLASPTFLGRVRDVTRSVDRPNAECLLFDADGVTRDGEQAIVPASLLCPLKRLGLKYLIDTHSVFLEAPPAHHFVVPSEWHADVFFRVGSAMADGAAIDFLAYCCLPFFTGQEVKHIYCDTGAISPVAYAINGLRSRIPPGHPSASVSSFGSYKGLPHFKFRDMARSIILISVSTSGRLARLLCKPGNDIQESDIVTLFTLYEPGGSANVVCNLRKDEGNPEGFGQVNNHPEEDCPLCKEGSTRIVISTEQFLPGRGKTEDLILKVTHSPRWLPPFLKQFVGTGVIRANYKSGDSNHATREVFFDLQTMFADADMLGIDPYVPRLWRTVDRVVPARLTRILCLDSPASRSLAERIKARLGEQWSGVESVNHRDVLTDVEGHRRTSGATLVVAAAAASGRSLQAVSQLLRTIQENGAITYLVALARFPDRGARDEVESNVTYGEQPKERGFFVVDHVFLPLMGSQTKTSWELELELIDHALLTPPDGPTREALEARGKSIRGASETRGMSDGLFWGKIDGDSLVLRPGFAFYDFVPTSPASQADVFFTVVAVLHSLRSDPRSSESLFQHEYRRRVLSPRCFDRFNDGVIQASILRAAHSAELDYSIDEKLSKDMWQVLDTIFSSSSTQGGEATLEFLVALAMRRLKLESKDLDKLKKKFSPVMEHPIARLLWTLIGRPCIQMEAQPAG